MATHEDVLADAVVGLPAYFYPWPGGSDWWRLAELDRPLLIVINPATGPGDAIDHSYEAAVAEAMAAGATILGYLDDGYGSRDPDPMLDEARTYREWYGVEGVFVDRTRADAAALPRLTYLVDTWHRSRLRVALNPGQPEVDPRYLQLADHVVLFEGDLAAYSQMSLRGWVHLHDRAKVWHLVYGVPREELNHVAGLAAGRHVGVLYATDRGPEAPWSALPSYWPEQPVPGSNQR